MELPVKGESCRGATLKQLSDRHPRSIGAADNGLYKIPQHNSNAPDYACGIAARRYSHVLDMQGAKMVHPNRKPLSKSMRFDVFKRDGFTCQYCGRRPPDVVLACDHIHPVAEGGQNTLENLVTSCSDCNIGKGAGLLGNKAIRPDADLMLVEVQQEIAEIRVYQYAAEQREQLRNELVESLQELWCETSGLEWCPSDAIMRQLLFRHEPWIIEQVVLDVSAKVANGYITGNKWDRYMWAVARNLAAQEEG